MKQRRRLHAPRLQASLLAAAVCCTVASAHARPIALVIGANHSIDTELRPLRYADDDAARYAELLKAVGMDVHLLVRPDIATTRLHRQTVAGAGEPTRAGLQEALATVAQSVRAAKAAGEETTFYFVFAGHGNIKDGEGYLTLEDVRLSKDDLLVQIIDHVGADENHLIVDACYSYFLAFSRGPGGTTEPARGFSAIERTERKVGLLLSTSSANESHEWEAFQSGVFSHEVRSGLHGAADVDLDGVVSYRELASFIDRSNQAIENDSYRPNVFARPIAGHDDLLNLRPALASRIEIDPSKSGHYYVEDQRGVRRVDFHHAAGQKLSLVRTSPETLYVRRASGEGEYEIPARKGPVRLAMLNMEKPKTVQRGAAHHQFKKLFTLPFSDANADAFVFPQPEPAELEIGRATDVAQLKAENTRPGWTTMGAVGLYAVAGASALIGGALTGAAAFTFLATPATANGMEVSERNQSIEWQNLASLGLYATAGVVASAATVVLASPMWMGLFVEDAD